MPTTTDPRSVQGVLPPLDNLQSWTSGDHANASGFIAGLRQESRSKRDPWLPISDDAGMVYLYGTTDWPPADIDAILLNDIQNVVLNGVQQQAGDHPRPTISPVDTGASGPWVYNGSPAIAAMLGIPLPGSDPDDRMAGIFDEDQLSAFLGQLTSSIAQQITQQRQQMAMQQAMQGMMTPSPGGMPAGPGNDAAAAAAQAMQAPASPDEVAAVLAQVGYDPKQWLQLDDQVKARWAQRSVDNLWNRAELDDWLWETLLRSGSRGWNFVDYGFDDVNKQPVLTCLSNWQVYPDPQYEKIGRMNYLVQDLFIDEGEALRRFPVTCHEMIRKFAFKGVAKQRPNGTGLGAPNNFQFYRRMIEITVCWLRNQTLQMPLQMAINKGAVVRRDVPDPEALAAQELSTLHPESIDDPNITGGGAVDQPAAAAQAEPGQDGMLPGGSAGGDPTQLAGGASGSFGVSTQARYFHPDTDEEIELGGATWPTYQGIRRLTLINEQVVDSRIEENWDISVLQFRNVPVPEQPFGIPEPFRLAMIQKAESRMVDATVENADFFRAPVATMPQSVRDQLGDDADEMFLKPGKIYSVRDTLFQATGGKVLNVEAGAAMPPVVSETIEVLRQKRIETSGWTEAARGILPTSGASGELVKALAQGSESIMASKSHSTESALCRLGRMMLHSVLTRLEIEDLKRLCGEFRDHVLVAFVILGREIEWDVKMETSTGSGRQAQTKKQEALAEFQVRDDTGQPLRSLQSTREACDLDHHTEEERNADQAEKLIQQQAAMAAAAGAGQPGAPPGDAKQPAAGE